jgi:hypothetical protein
MTAFRHYDELLLTNEYDGAKPCSCTEQQVATLVAASPVTGLQQLFPVANAVSKHADIFRNLCLNLNDIN